MELVITYYSQSKKVYPGPQKMRRREIMNKQKKLPLPLLLLVLGLVSSTTAIATTRVGPFCTYDVTLRTYEKTTLTAGEGKNYDISVNTKSVSSASYESICNFQNISANLIARNVGSGAEVDLGDFYIIWPLTKVGNTLTGSGGRKVNVTGLPPGKYKFHTGSALVDVNPASFELTILPGAPSPAPTPAPPSVIEQILPALNFLLE
jgi:hypothetical protein